MTIAVDTNILFSFFWENSITKRLITNLKLNIISPEMAISELQKYSEDIIKRLNASRKEFNDKLENLKSTVKFIKIDNYRNFLKEAESFSPDKKDAEFLALCLKERCILWSNDSLLKTQNRVKVLSTKEVIELLSDFF